ncbi:MAG TPA: hypothetical protein VN032_06845 [Thermoanaerobaculia bacterium]|jgi:hypothetical protein|nr:hypothetical protein [Thermoanaerobaculia bacterium]
MMNAPLRPLRSLALAAAVLAAAPLLADTVRNHFDTDSPMRPPGFFDLVVLGAQAPARWLILTDLNPPSAPNRLSQVDAKRPDDSIAAAVRRNYVFQDGSVSTYVKRGGSRAGLLLRMADEKNFLVLLVDGNTGQAVLSSYRDGKAAELGRGKVALGREWEKFAVVAKGPSLTVLFDDAKVFEATDPKPVTGKTGLVTAGPGDASFDEFILETGDTAAKP